MVIMQQLPEITVASLTTEHPTDGSRLMEIILERGNMFKALKRVRDNKGVPGIDNMTVDQLPGVKGSSLLLTLIIFEQGSTVDLTPSLSKGQP